MSEDFVVKVSTTIDASVAQVWEALTTPELIKQYLFGTDVISEWKEGSSITYRGEWEGKRYEDKGTILKLVPEKVFESTYWSSMEGLADKPQNYKKVTYTLVPDGDSTLLTLTQDNNATREGMEHSKKNWTTVLEALKKLLEKKD